LTQRRARALWLVALLCPAPACVGAPEPSAPGAPPGITANGVTIEVPVAGGTLVARGDALALVDGGAGLLITGDAGIALGDPGLTVRADSLRLAADGSQIELTGGVRAVLSAPAWGAADAGR
jgi:hypothetical protein